jgi:hypothetical protein
MKALQLVVSDGAAARADLAGRGIEVSDLMVLTEADGGTFFGFQDPDGNSWTVQEIKARATKPPIPEDHTGLSELRRPLGVAGRAAWLIAGRRLVLRAFG